MLEIQSLTAGYGNTQILHGLTMTVSAGEIHAFLGRNGAGKTTTLRRIMGLLPHMNGRIVVRGQDTTHWPTPRIARSGVGFVPEGREVFTTLTVRENLSLAARIGRGDWTIDRIGGLFPNLIQRLGVPAGALSGGEQQMLAIGRALMTSPRLMLLDEPSEGLSVQMLDVLRQALSSLKAEGMTVLLVEQNVRFATELADQVTLMSRGRSVWSGNAEAFAQSDETRKEYLGA